MRDILFIARSDLRQVLRARETILWVFVMPIIFFYFIGTITSGFSGGGGEATPIALVEGADAGFLADEVARRLEEQGYRVVRAPVPGGTVAASDPDPGNGAEPPVRRLLIPPAFTDSILAGRPATLRFERDAEGPMNDLDDLRVKRAAYTVLADVVVLRETAGSVSPGGMAGLAAMPHALTLEVAPAGRRLEPPGGFEHAIPGIMVMFTLLVLTTSGAVFLVMERRQGLLRRLACTPIRRQDLVLGKWLGRLVVGLVQIGFAMLAGTLLFAMDWGPDLPMIGLVMLAYGAIMASLGMILGSVARTDGQAAAIGVITANVFAALGGCWWPIEITPPWMQTLQLFLPTGWAMHALHRLISFAAGPASVVPHIAGMTVAAAILLAVSARVFRYE